MKTTVRNLRIREDRAKYLYNLDPNSAYYDPKTRAMRDNPMPETAAEDLVFAGDNFIRYVGCGCVFVYGWGIFSGRSVQVKRSKAAQNRSQTNGSPLNSLQT